MDSLFFYVLLGILGILLIWFMVHVIKLALKPIELPEIEKKESNELKLYKLNEIFRKTYSTPSWFLLGMMFSYALALPLLLVGTLPFMPFLIPTDKLTKIVFYQFGSQKIIGAVLFILGLALVYLIAKKLGSKVEEKKKKVWNDIVQENAPELILELKGKV